MTLQLTSYLQRLSDVWFAWMLPMAWQVTLLASILALLTWLLRHRSARLRYALWLLVPIRLMIPPSFAFVTGWAWWMLPPEIASPRPSPQVFQVEDRERRSADLLASSSGQPVQGLVELAGRNASARQLENSVADGFGVNAQLPITAEDDARALSGPFWIGAAPQELDKVRSGLVAGWLLITTTLATGLVVGALRVRRLVARSVSPSVGISDLTQDCRRRVGLRRRVRVRETHEAPMPMVVGVFRPVILMPARIGQHLNRAELQAVLLHELQHVARHDVLAHFLQTLLGIVYFFHPAVWFTRCLSNRLREQACDEATLAVLKGHRRAYGSGVVKVAEMVTGHAPRMALGVVESGRQVKRRLRRILSPGLPLGRRLSGPAVLFLILVGAVMLPAAARQDRSAPTTSSAVESENAGVAADDGTRRANEEPSPAGTAPATTDPAPASRENLGVAEAPAIDIKPSAPRAVELAPPVRLHAGGQPIDVGGFAAPFVGDFDEDGKDDLLVGQLDYGRLRIYRNIGSKTQPRFDRFKWFKVNDQIVSIPAGCAVGFTPHLADFDADGRTDLLTGSFVGGLLYVFRRQEDGSFAPAEVLENREGHVQLLRPKGLQYNSTVFWHDWDGDGDGDLLTGRSRYCLVPNEGTRQQPIFGAAVRLAIDGEPLATGRVPPCVADWDGDGRDDLLCGAGADIVWYRNVGRSGQPVLESPRVLIDADDLGPYRDAGPDHLRQKPSRRAYSICVADYNDDGQLDLLLGDHYYLKRTLTDEQKAQHAAASKQRNAFWSDYRKWIKDAPELSSRQERVASFRAALDGWQAISPPFAGPQAAQMGMDRHAGVWLYLRIAAE